MEDTKNYPNKLAVFEHISHKRSKNPKRYGRHVSSLTDDSDSDTQIEISRPVRRFQVGVRLTEEPLDLMCLYVNCTFKTTNYDDFIKHILTHVPQEDLKSEDGELDKFECKWSNCNFKIEDVQLLEQHLVFHGYIMKLKNIGQNVLERLKLPLCCRSPVENLSIFRGGFICEWKNCNIVYGNVYTFFNHIKQHVNCFPKNSSDTEIIECEWIGCSLKCPSQYKLADHVRSHSKERVAACPTCEATFATKTKLCDHRRRQLPPEDLKYQCSQCTKMYPSERLLKDHIRSHVNHYKCPMCDMTCTKPSTLATHIRYRHLSERPVACSLCEYKAVSKNDLLQHLIVHCSKNLYECEECEFSCRSLTSLDSHYQKVHDHLFTLVYECHVCKQTYNKGNKLTKHFIKVHGFSWPSGHSRFRYKEDSDGVYRLQTVRYESLEVTQEIINSNNFENVVTNGNYKLKRKLENKTDIPEFAVVKEDVKKNVLLPTNNSVLITINDVDEQGNIVNSEVIESNEMKLIKTKDENGEQPMNEDFTEKISVIKVDDNLMDEKSTLELHNEQKIEGNNEKRKPRRMLRQRKT